MDWQERVGLIVAITITGFIGVIGLLVVWKILINQIKIDMLISDESGNASLSRFQFLIFTFVIAGGLLFLILNKSDFPNIPNGVLALLGISGGSFVVAKGIQSNIEVEKIKSSTGDGNDGLGPNIGSLGPNTGPTAGGTSVTITGTGFMAGAKVTFGGVTAPTVAVVSPTSMTAITPAHSAGIVDVDVTNTNNQKVTLQNGFTYQD
jgi:IPT/TIG domain